MSNAPDRVWLAKNVYGGWYVVNPGAVKWHKDSPVYILADLHEQLQAENERLKAQIPQWISVEDELPEKGKDVLVYPGFKTGYCHPNGGWFVYLGRKSYSDTISHWMPLPEPPENSDE